MRVAEVVAGAVAAHPTEDVLLAADLDLTPDLATRGTETCILDHTQEVQCPPDGVMLETEIILLQAGA